MRELVSCESKLNVHERSYPVRRFRRVALTGHVFGEKNVARSESLLRAVAQADFNAARESNAPLAARRGMPTLKIIAVHIVFEDQRLGGNAGQEVLRSFVLI